jgi:hypothetical protein
VAIIGLTPLGQPLEVTLRLIVGKQVAPEEHTARLLEASPSGAAMATDCFLARFSDIRLEFSLPPGETVYLNGKVMRAETEERPCPVKFSGLEPELAQGLRQLTGQKVSEPEVRT